MTSSALRKHRGYEMVMGFANFRHHIVPQSLGEESARVHFWGGECSKNPKWGCFFMILKISQITDLGGFEIFMIAKISQTGRILEIRDLSPPPYLKLPFS